MNEWKSISGLNDKFSININGKIKRNKHPLKINNHPKNKIRSYPERILKPDICNGYYRIALWWGNKIIMRDYLHRIIAKEFIPNPNQYKYINHKDGNKLNNSLENLEWCTATHNACHAKNNGLNNNRLENHANAKLTNIEVSFIKEMFSLGVSDSDIAEAYNCSRGTINSIRIGKSWYKR